MSAANPKKVSRDEVLGFTDYEKTREAFRSKVLEQKRDRRVHLGEYFTLLFENHDTVLYQIQEMIRAERIEREKDILHEIDAYNELTGGVGELGATLLIEIDDAGKRQELLSRWQGVPEAFYVETTNGDRVHPEFDRRQVSGGRISAVHYLTFPLGDRVPARVGLSFPGLEAVVDLEPGQARALAADLVGARVAMP
jgi:hypothetical protein